MDTRRSVPYASYAYISLMFIHPTAVVKYTLRGTESQISAAQACIRMLFEEVDNYSPDEAAMAPAARPQGVVIGPKV